MLTRLAAIVRKEFIQVIRDPRTLGIVLVMPAMQLFLFGYAINTTVDHIPTVVLDQSLDGASRSFIAAFAETGYFNVVGAVSSYEGVRRALDAGDAQVGFVIPPTFGDDVGFGRFATTQLLIDGSDPNIAQTALFAATAIGQAYSIRAANQIDTPVRVDVRPVVLYNPSMLSVNFMVPGLIGVILQTQALILTAFAVVRERERGTLEQLIVTPVTPWELMLGKIVPYVIIALAQVAVAMFVGTQVFHAPLEGSVTLLFVLSFVFLLGSLGIGLLVSTVSRTQTQAMQTAFFFILPSLLLSGFMFPREGMPLALHDLGFLIPLTYFLKILRGIMLKGIDLSILWPQVLPLAVFGVAVFAASALRFRKTLG